MKITETAVRKLLSEILAHQIANLGHPTQEFYACYTYRHGKFPAWVPKAKKMLKRLTPVPKRKTKLEIDGARFMAKVMKAGDLLPRLPRWPATPPKIQQVHGLHFVALECRSLDRATCWRWHLCTPQGHSLDIVL